MLNPSVHSSDLLAGCDHGNSGTLADGYGSILNHPELDRRLFWVSIFETHSQMFVELLSHLLPCSKKSIHRVSGSASR